MYFESYYTSKADFYEDENYENGFLLNTNTWFLCFQLRVALTDSLVFYFFTVLPTDT